MAAVAVASAVVAWRTGGSIAAPDWLPVAVFAALVTATVAAAGVARRAPRHLVVGLVALAALAAWTAASIAWAPSQASARDEALLVALYAVVLGLPGLALSDERQRIAATGWVVATIGVVGVATAVDAAVSSHPLGLFFDGRLDSPVSYVNASSALMTIAVWPAIVLSARRAGNPVLRAAALGAAGLLLALAVAAQSKGTIVGIALSAVLVFALAPSRLRLLLPLLLAAAPAAAAAAPLTAPYRTDTVSAAHGVGTAALFAGATSLVLGAVYAALDGRIDVPARARRIAGRVVLALVAVVVVAGVATFVVRVPHPGSWFSQKWSAFKHPEASGGATHLSSLGSNRYDFWRVALDEARTHPAAGIGGRGFYTAYLQHRRSGESPLRAHSLYLDTLAEEGVPGLILLLIGLGAPLLLIARRLAQPSAVGAFGAATYFAGHAAVDWIWTVAVVGVPALLLLGIGAAGDDGGQLRRRSSAGVAALALALAVFGFAPPWLSFRYVAAAYHAGSPSTDLARARTLDPLSLEPDWAEWRLATTAVGRVAALERALRQEPQSVAVLYQLGLTEIDAGHRAAARRFLLRARALDPRDAAIRAAVARVEHG